MLSLCRSVLALLVSTMVAWFVVLLCPAPLLFALGLPPRRQPAEEFLSHPTDKWLKAAATTAGAVVIMGITGILVSTGLH